MKQKIINILIASDHAGFKLKEYLISKLNNTNQANSYLYNVKNLGCFSEVVKVDYPDYASILCAEMKKNIYIGILLCDSGIGMSIASNRYKWIRGALCRTTEDAKFAKNHNDANILILGARYTTNEAALNILDTFINEKLIKEGRYIKRIEKIS